MKHVEIGQLFDRLRLVETGVEVVKEGMKGLNSGQARIEHQLGLIVQAQLEREKAATPGRRLGAS